MDDLNNPLPNREVIDLNNVFITVSRDELNALLENHEERLKEQLNGLDNLIENWSEQLQLVEEKLNESIRDRNNRL